MTTKTDIGRASTVNLVSKIDEDKQAEIAQEIIQHYLFDLDSRKDWEEKRARWYKLWACKLDEKTTPWAGASNVCVPLLSNACNQFHARSYQAIFAPPGLVKTLPVGEEDEDRARNVEKFMNWQLQYEMEEYEEVFDKLLQLLPINGLAFKKIFFSKEKERPVTESINVLDLIVPYRTKSLETARRITHRLYLHYEELQDRDDAGLYENFDKVFDTASKSEEADPVRDEADEITGEQASTAADEPHVVLEVHKNYDIGDGQRKPYIFTVDETSGVLLRVTSREYQVDGETKVMNHFIDYHFIPNPDGFYSFGFGHFLEQLNEMANTAFNQVFDSGSLTNIPFFFYGRKAGLKKSNLKLEPGKGFEVDDATQVFFPTMQRVDQTLFQILAAAQQYTEIFTSTSEYLSGREAKGTKTPTAHGTLAIIEQGLVTFAVMTKRIFRQLRKELRIIMEQNQIFLSDEKEYRVMGAKGIAFADIKKEDFGGVADIIPIGDPSYASRSTRRAEANELYQLLRQEPIIAGTPPDENGQGGTPPNEPAIHALITNLLDSYDIGNRSQILPDLPDKQLSPDDENALFMSGDYKAPVSGEDHEAHLALHHAFSQSEHFEKMPDDYQDLVLLHIQQTDQMMFIDARIASQGGIGGIDAEQGGNQSVA